jgi:transposase
LARHYREAEGLSNAQIADRLGRSPATIKAYFYDPSNANKRPTDTPRGQRQPRRSAAQPHGRSLPALELTTARYTRAYQSQHQERKFFPRRIFFARERAVQHFR